MYIENRRLKMMKETVNSLKKYNRGFKHVIKVGDSILSDRSLNHFNIASYLIKNDSYQVRMLGTYILGQLSPNSKRSLSILEVITVNDKSWQVQEMTGKAFDYYCKVRGYEESLPEITKWIKSKNPNVRRSVVEGLRVWTVRPYFKDNPEVAIKLLSSLKDDENKLVRKSAASALRDIRRRHIGLIGVELQNWDLENPLIKDTYNHIVNT